MKRLLMIWALVWSIGGGVSGMALALGEEGHIPRPLLPLVLGLAGLVAGGIGGLLRLSLPIARPSPGGEHRVREIFLGAAIGGLTGAASWYAGLGLPLIVGITFGALFGALAGWTTRFDGGRSGSKPGPRPTSKEDHSSVES